MPEFDACSRIRKGLVTIWNFPVDTLVLIFVPAIGETQSSDTMKCMEKFKLWLDALVRGYVSKSWHSVPLS